MRRFTTQRDEIDANLITLLQSDGRQPNTELARRLGLAEATVRKRLDRLLTEQVIQVGARADPIRVGYQTYAFIEMQVEGPDVEKIAEQLTVLPEILFLGVCAGHADIIAAALFRSNEHMYEFLTKRLRRFPGIRRTATMSVIRILKREYAFPIPGASIEPTNAPKRRRVRGGRGRRPARRSEHADGGPSR